MIATLLFQPRFIRKMIEIGEEDGVKRAGEIAAFLNLSLAQPLTADRATLGIAA
jgi:hypothetical protein